LIDLVKVTIFIEDGHLRDRQAIGKFIKLHWRFSSQFGEWEYA